MKLYCFVGQRPYVLPAQGAALWIKEKNDPVSAQRANHSIATHGRMFGPLGRLCFPYNLSRHQGDALAWENFSPFGTANGSSISEIYF